ncbi:LuxR C-terminal-related transcriptional regulator [Egicoccus sp. AB-alg6-2]|uniref:LuxR C-terminal-related transcriptional regulator n=1 Tax=Egicoccus sp. AB-alg6-2 TaxID=3242692 RepID=UPI00359EF3CC
MVTTGTQGRRVLVVDDHGLLAQSLGFALRDRGLEVEVCGELTADAILAAATDPPVDVALLDLDVGGDLGTSVPLIPELTDRGARVLMLTGVTDRLRLAECVEAGAIGVMSKAQPFDQLVEAVERAVERGEVFAPGEREQYLADLRRLRSEQQARMAPFEQLTPRERHVLQSLMDGASAEQIATSAVVSLATVRSQIRSVLQKLGLNSQLSAVAMARKVGWSNDTD